MTIKQITEKVGWINESRTDTTPNDWRYMNVKVCFVNNEGKDDETEFSIRVYDANELNNLFDDFCKENKYNRNSVSAIIITQVAPTMDILD